MAVHIVKSSWTRRSASDGDRAVLRRGRGHDDRRDLSPHVAIVKNSGWHMARHSGEQIRHLVECGWRVTAIADYRLGGRPEVSVLGASTYDLPFESAGTNPAKNLNCLIQTANIL